MGRAPNAVKTATLALTKKVFSKGTAKSLEIVLKERAYDLMLAAGTIDDFPNLNDRCWLQAAVRAMSPSRPVTGSPEAVTRLRLPQNVACGFPALRSSERDTQHSECLELPVWQGQAWSL
jgi:hypothetical protein